MYRLKVRMVFMRMNSSSTSRTFLWWIWQNRSGIGGTVIQRRKLHRGKDLFGGEFGYMMLDDTHTLSDLGSPVKSAERYRQEMKLEKADGTLLFSEADRGEPVAVKYVESLIDALARGIYNL